MALLPQIPSSTDEILDFFLPIFNPLDSRVAVFYSISNSQHGLQGIGFGNILIKRTVEHLQTQFPHVTTFCTLSPVPKFLSWLSNPSSKSIILSLLTDEEVRMIVIYLFIYLS